jgi:ubiquinone/menaquinone biosynthesis C-methylase UbiE
MFGFLKSRRRVAEWMDASDADPVALRRSLAFIRRINSLLGYTRSTLAHLKRFSRHWKSGEHIRILDVATGSADIPRTALEWGNARGLDLKITGIDLHPRTLQIAAENPIGLCFVRADARCLPFADGSFDYAMAAMFLHHLSNEEVVQVLREMNRVAARGVIISDLLRNRRAYAWITLFTLFSIPMVKHDARASVAHAFNKKEILDLCAAAGLDYVAYHKHFGHRFVIAGERSGSAKSH